MSKILITGGCGFLGSHMVDYLLKNTDYDIVCLDRLDTSGTLHRLNQVLDDPAKKARVSFVFHDLKAEINEFVAQKLGKDIDYIIHIAASSHVDRSIIDPLSFVMDNVVGTTNLLNWARTLPNLKRFLNFSTDESVGPAPIGYDHVEEDPHRPSNPYSASKAGQEDIGYSFFVTYKLPVITTRTMNIYGPMQHAEKLLPKAIRHVQQDQPMPIHSEIDDNGNVVFIGSRYWIHVSDVADAVWHILNHGNVGEFYNVIGFDERNNYEIAAEVAKNVGKELQVVYQDVHKQRPGHDRRYALDGTKLKNLGWTPKYSIEAGIADTVAWTLQHPEWL